MATVMLLDGNSLTYRAFYALPTDLATASGQVTNAVYGFTSMLLNLVRDHRPDVVAVAFDRPEPTFRHELDPGYKAQRETAPDILRQQMGLVREVVETLGLPILEVPGYEADDVIATLATRAAEAGHDVLIVTGDRDAFQLVADPHIRVLYNKRGVSDYALYDEAGIRERTGVAPADYVAYAALRGDSSDNLPGVPGVGEKTAARLINTYGDVEGVLAHLDELTPKLRANLAEAADRVRRNAEIMVLRRDVPLDVAVEDLGPPRPDPDAVRRLFDFLEFHSLSDRLAEAFGDLGVGGRAGEVLEPVIRTPAPGEAPGVLAGMGEPPPEGRAVAGAWEGEPGRSPLAALALVADPGSGEVVVLGADALADPAVREALEPVLAGPVAGHGVKPLIRGLRAHGLDVPRLVTDTEVAAYLLDPAEGSYDLAGLVARHTGHRLPDTPDDGQLALDVAPTPPAERAATEALAVARLAPVLLGAVEAQGVRRLHDEVEIPLVRVLAKMEEAGIAVDVDGLRALNEELAAEADRLRDRIWEVAGEKFNVNSTPQLRHILFERLGLPPQKRTKTGYSTDAQTLERLREHHEIADLLLQYREVEKLRSTFAEGLLAEVAADGRIHATFHQTVARTGRLSSDRPNLHNIPVRTEIGRRFRRCFIAPEGHQLLVADYNQIELRCIAHLASDPGLLAAFAAGTDVHTEVAARVFGVPPAEVTPTQRARAKMVSYGLAYGMEAYGLGQRLNIPTEEAAAILDAYFGAFPEVKAYMDRTVAEARERGYTETLFGRRRPIPELQHPNRQVRLAGERQAMNAGIQGLAADIFKVALVALDTALEERGCRSRLVLQVHDEVIVEAADEEIPEVTDLTVAAMRDAFDLRVPLEVNVAVGPTWADAKP